MITNYDLISGSTDRLNVRIGIWRLFVVLIIVTGYLVIYPASKEWLIFGAIWIVYAGLWLMLLGKHTGDRPNVFTYIFSVGDIAFFIFALSFERDLLTNYSTLLIIPLFQYLLRYGRKAAFFYISVSTMAILYICFFRYGDHPMHHIVVIIVMILITLNEGFLLEESNRLRKQLYELVIYDDLSGLYNYRYFCNSLEREFGLAQRLSESLTLIMIDVDNFKKYNDTHGHEAGNTLIREIARIISENVRDYDYACRYGGEEFAVILPHTEAEEGRLVAERIREAVCSHRFLTGETTVSMGVAAFPGHLTEKGDLIVNADKALYTSKVKGKNRVTVYNDESEELKL